MPIINNIFGGKLNLDTQEYRISQGDYIDALNITRDSPGEGQDVVVTNVIGNTKVDYSLPPAIPHGNKCIGKYVDKIRNRVYYFVWNNYGKHSILFLNRDTNVITKLIENITDTNGVDILKFNPSYKINHIDIIYNDIYGDLLLWTDGLNTPRKLNVSHILDGNYTTLQESFIEIAKSPPLSPPTCVYGTDTTINSNALRRKLFMFAYRFQYDDFEKSSFSTYSKIPLPIGYYGSDNDNDNTSNNFITVTVETGEQNVVAIEILMRYSIGDNWSDWVLATSLNKSHLTIADNSTYQYLFYNDNIYPPITDGVQYVDGVQSIPLFDWVPQLAFNQVIANGNTPVYGAIQENYNNIPVSDLDVTITAANVTNVPPDTDPPSITYTTTSSTTLVFSVNGNVPTGTRYQIYLNFQGNPGIGQTFGPRLVGDYTSILGDTIDSVALALSNQFNAYASVPTIAVSYPAIGFNSWQASGFVPTITVTQIVVTPGSSGGGTISTEKTWLWDANYIFGLVYVDEQNRDMPGVTTFTNPTDSANDFSVTTPTFSESGGSAQTPVITAQINHLPPAGAVKYYWVRRRQTYSSFVQYMTADFQDPGDGFLYFCLANIEKFKLKNSQFIYATAPITSESRIRIMAEITGSAYTSNIWSTNNDYQILGTVTRTITGGTTPADDKTFIKVKKPAAAISPSYSFNMLVMVYTPMANPTSTADAVYWEWGEAYDIYTLNGVRYHRGKDQDQTATQPAIFTWEEGDVYFHDRTMYDGAGDASTTTDTVALMDANWSDFFDSAVNDNGRAQVIEVNARQIYNPVLYRFGGSYQSGTTINEINKFYFEDFDEADRSYGDIRKMFIRDRYLYVFQKFKIGVIPVLLQIIRDTSGNPLEANSDQLLNKINYPFSNDVGIGDVPESFASDKYAMYGVDDYRGVVWRLSQDGITVLSVLYECASFFATKLPNYRKSLNSGYPANGQSYYLGDPTVYGVFDSYTNKYIIAMEEINRYNSQGYLTFHQDGYTISFNEVRNNEEGFESFYSYKPEQMASIDNQFITFKDGELWLHTLDSTRCNFYGTQYDASITAVFNDNSLEKKTWQAVTELSSDVWECPLIYTNLNSYGSQRQESKLIPQNFRKLETTWNSAILRDSHSNGGLYNGSIIKGNYIVIKFLKQNATSLVYLNGASVRFADSPLTNK